jgi:hypothetical protein
LLAKIARGCKKVLRGIMPDRDVSTIRDLTYYQYAKIIAKSAFAASGGREGNRLKHRGDKKLYDSIPLVLEKRYLKTIYDCHNCSGTLGKGDLDRDGVITVLDIDVVTR